MPRLSPNKLTESYVAGLKPGKHGTTGEPATKVYWDREIPGFGIQVRPGSKRGTGRKTFYLKYRSPEGEQVWLRLCRYTGDESLADARAKAAEYVALLDDGKDPRVVLQKLRMRHTVESWAKHYLEALAALVKNGKRSPATEDSVKLAFKLALPYIGKLRLEDVERANIRDLHKKITAGERPGKKMGKRPGRPTPILANRVVAHLSNLFTEAEKEGHRPQGTNPCKWVQDRSVEQSAKRFLSSLELEWIGKALRIAPTWDPKVYGPVVDPYAVAALRLLLLTGARREEILRLRWEQVDLEKGIITVLEHKTKQRAGTKALPLNAPAKAVLNDLLTVPTRQLGNPYVIQGHRHYAVVDGVETGGHLRNLRAAWERIKAAAGKLSEGAVDIGGARIHDLRHTFATAGVSAGRSLAQIGGLLGHIQAGTTQKYAHKDVDPMRETSEAIAAQLSAVHLA